MLAALDERLTKLMELYPGMSMQKQDYDERENSPFILAIVTPLMKRVHSMVSLTPAKGVQKFVMLHGYSLQ